MEEKSLLKLANGQLFHTDASYVRLAMPKRKPDGHKGDFGKDYILGGSAMYTGAPVLAAKACTRVGAGLVFLGVPRSIHTITAIKLSSEMPEPLPEKSGKISIEAYDKITAAIEKCDAVLIGPGLGKSSEIEEITALLTEKTAAPLIIDADGLNALSNRKEALIKRGARGLSTIITPHEGEFKRLGGNLTSEGRLNSALSFAKKYCCTVVLKGHITITADPSGLAALNTTGNSGMAKGGSGDILSGMIAGLVGQGAKPFEAAVLAVWLHGLAGDLAAKKFGEYGMTPSDLLLNIPEAILSLGPL